MKKELIRKILCVILIVGTMTTVLFGCGNGGTEDDNYDGTADDNNSVAEDLVDVTVNEYLEPDEDGVVKLYNGLYTDDVSHELLAKSYETQKWYGSHHHLYDYHYFVYKHADTQIKKVNKEYTVGICDDYLSNSIEIIPIVDTPRFTIPVFFDRVETSSGNIYYDTSICFIRILDEPMVDLESWRYEMIEECNGQDFTEFMENNAIPFYRGEEQEWSCSCEDNKAEYYEIHNEEYYKIYLDVYNDRHIMIADKNEEIELGRYEGTQWISQNFTADIEFYTPCVEEVIELPLEKRKNGYFTMDCSKLNGVYYIPKIECFIEIV